MQIEQNTNFVVGSVLSISQYPKPRYQNWSRDEKSDIGKSLHGACVILLNFSLTGYFYVSFMSFRAFFVFLNVTMWIHYCACTEL